MAKSLESLMAKLPAKVVEEAEREADRQRPVILALLALQELRKERGLSQEDLAEALGIKQSAVSRLERRTDMYVSTLKDMVAAMGGDLHLVARFPEGEVEIGQFKDIGNIARLAKG